MELLEVVVMNGREICAEDYKIEDFTNPETRKRETVAVPLPPCARRKIEYYLVERDGKKYWMESEKWEFIHEDNSLLGRWRQCYEWEHSDEELMRQTELRDFYQEKEERRKLFFMKENEEGYQVVCVGIGYLGTSNNSHSDNLCTEYFA